MPKTDVSAETLMNLTADIVSAYLGNVVVAVSDIPALIRRVHQALADLDHAPVSPVMRQAPAVSVRASVKPDHLICLEDGKAVKLLKRYLMTRHRMTPDEYRAKWNLPADYPMVAPAYAEQRRALAKRIGLGTLPRRS